MERSGPRVLAWVEEARDGATAQKAEGGPVELAALSCCLVPTQLPTHAIPKELEAGEAMYQSILVSVSH